MAALPVGDADWRDVGSREAERCLCGVEAVVVFLDECAIACCWGGWVSAECDCDILGVLDHNV